ncbi:hypothetical protein AGABI1DRAFT_134347 [Agaricus bisporus var. burnettii JB137-S8]|uniref:Uncharacterized protein n=1 Tax=Agaricus bisporus var. burnettii (strain JB137-S8 / ATCC MYA-4627 / FGSC 10392) TaxID=597362 RepID=K5WSZ0_AGABU|nr:uncharacterized protein AGABI1DRAFT_134347 [Agaricus bisporus var. burnettii JB137-S8]EKM73647.1 hypothetical protein AGABI1DRAFT_134347 [Agaricus bisporus var. burnettii JB137-S8]
MPSSDGRGTRQGPLVRLQTQASPYHIKTCFKGNSWYEITDKEGNEILPSHLQGGPWFQAYQEVKAADNSPLFARLMRVMLSMRSQVTGDTATHINGLPLVREAD